MVKNPGLVRDRPNMPHSAAGQQLLTWLMERKGLEEEAAETLAGRMVALGILQPLPGAPSKGFSSDKAALYRVNPQAGIGGGGGAGGGGGGPPGGGMMGGR